MLLSGLLPREAGQVIYRPCPLHFHDGMEDGLPIYRQEHQEEGKISIAFLPEADSCVRKCEFAQFEWYLGFVF